LLGGMWVRAEEEGGISSLVVEESALVAGGGEVDEDIPAEAYTINWTMGMRSWSCLSALGMLAWNAEGLGGVSLFVLGRSRERGGKLRRV
jgi:hypothetical protein